MSNVLVVAEQFEGKLKKSSLHALQAGKELAGRTGGRLIALVMGKGIGDAAAELAACGVEVWSADDARLEHLVAEHAAKVVEKACKDASATYVLAPAASQAKDFLPRVAARLGAGMASDVMGFGGSGADVTFRRPMWAGSVIAEVEITTPVKLATVRTTEFPAAEKAGAGGEVKPFSLPELGEAKTKVLEFKQVKSARPELTEARVVVSGGRGTKGDFKPIEALADELGAAVGASRAVVDAGWVPNDLQVGQTGKTVAPELYIALGISGAIQHIAGMKGSKVIVAINKDPEAPIFQIADYGLVGDLFKIAPELTEAIKAAR